jgi:hypothetical protein
MTAHEALWLMKVQLQRTEQNIQAIKVLEKRIEILGKEWDKKDAEFDNCEMVCDHEFLQNDLANI